MADSKAQGNPYCALTEFGTLRCTTGISIHVVSPLTALCTMHGCTGREKQKSQYNPP